MQGDGLAAAVTQLVHDFDAYLREAVFSAAANCHDSPLLAPRLDLLDDLAALPEQVTVHLDRGYDSAKTRSELAARGLRGRSPARATP